MLGLVVNVVVTVICRTRLFDRSAGMCPWQLATLIRLSTMLTRPLTTLGVTLWPLKGKVTLLLMSV